MSDLFRVLVENAPDAIVVSRAGIVIYANTAAAALLGHADVSELVGKPMTFLDARSLEVMRRRGEQMAATGERLGPREYPARRKDGTEITAEIASAIIEFDGAPAVLAYARDVTERTRLRAQLTHADRLASLGVMAAGVAHEINNPLAYMALAADMLMKRASSRDAPLLTELRGGVDRIAGIVRDLRAFGRDDDDLAGPVDLATVIDAAERLVAHEIRPRATLVKELGSLPPVMGVARQIEQVFVNLLLNAALAQGDKSQGRIVVRARTEDDRVIVSVEDDGCGIAEEHLSAIFEPFFTTRRHAGGTGLGLSISRDIVVRAGGSLTVSSTVGKGTTMTVTLLRATIGARRVPSAPAMPALVRKRILIVDDEPAIVRSLVHILGERAEVVGESAPERALPLILAEPAFDVIVCDVMMPGLSGIDLHEEVARAMPGREKRFLFISGGAYTTRTRDYLKRIPNVQLAKPFAARDLVDAIARVAS